MTFADRYGRQIEHWDGVDLSVDARLGRGLRVQGGTSTGNTVTDMCAILSQLPEISPLGGPYCHQDTGLTTQMKGLATYTVPISDA